MNVRFVFRPSKTYKTRGSIQCRLIVNGKRAPAFSTGIELNRADWNARLQQIKGRSERSQTDNTTLERVRGKLVNIYNYLDTAGLAVSAEKIKDVYVGKRVVDCTFFAVVTSFLASERQRVGKGKGRITLPTYKTKLRRLEHLQEFLTSTGRQHLLARDLNVAIAGQWVADLERTYSTNYIAKHVDLLHELMNHAVQQEQVLVNKLVGFGYSREKPGRPVCLTVDEINCIEATDLAEKPEAQPYIRQLNDVRDMLLFMCAVGMHYVDYVQLTSQDLRIHGKKTFIIIDRHKSEEEAIIPLLPTAKRLIDKYGSIEKLPRLGNAQANKWLKVLAVICEINKPISTKYGRRSFTDYFLNEMKWPRDKVQKMLGLTSDEYLRHYGDIDHRALQLDETV